MPLLFMLACSQSSMPNFSSFSPTSSHENVSESEALSLEADGLRNVVLVQADALALSHLSNYGYTRDTAPGLSEWWTMEGLSSVGSWTGPSVASMMSGVEPQRHNVLYSNQGSLNATLEVTPLAEHFNDQGFATLLVSGNNWVTPQTGLGRGFTDFEQTAKTYPQSDLSNQRGILTNWLDDQSGEQPFFAMLHAMDTHSSYFSSPEVAGTWAEDVPFDTSAGYPTQEEEIADAYASNTPGLVQSVNDIYDEEILGLDLEISRLQSDLAERGLLDNTLIVLTTDHGEFLGEDGFFGHGGSLDATLVHIPLLMSNPHLAPTHQNCVAENVDTIPTIMHALGMELPEGIDGRALQSGCRDWAASAQYEADVLSFTSVDDGDYKLTLNCMTGRTEIETTASSMPSEAVVDALYGHLQDYTADIVASVPGLSCQVPAMMSNSK